MSAPWQPVLDFWFHAPEHPDYLQTRVEWFQKNPDFDESIRQQFGALVQQAVAGGLREWEADTQGALARVLLLDQFTRNIWRDTAQAFAGDHEALALALRLIERGADATLASTARPFVYMPLMHAEDLALQERCVALFQALAAADARHASGLDYAIRHRDIIARFGRFPHRNRQLGRQSTPEEAQFLTQPNSGF